MRDAGLALLLACLGLTGCSGLFRSNAKPEQIYYLRPPAASAAAPAASGAAATVAPSAAEPMSLRVVRPLADPGLDTTHIMLVPAAALPAAVKVASTSRPWRRPTVQSSTTCAEGASPPWV